MSESMLAVAAVIHTFKSNNRSGNTYSPCFTNIYTRTQKKSTAGDPGIVMAEVTEFRISLFNNLSTF